MAGRVASDGRVTGAGEPVAVTIAMRALAIMGAKAVVVPKGRIVEESDGA